MNGDIPELGMFPADVQEYIKANFEKALNVFVRMKVGFLGYFLNLIIERFRGIMPRSMD